MFRYLSIFFFCLAAVLWSQEEWDWDDDDEDDWDEVEEVCSGLKFSYNGMEIECREGCGHLNDPIYYDIHYIFKECLRQTMGRGPSAGEPHRIWDAAERYWDEIWQPWKCYSRVVGWDSYYSFDWRVHTSPRVRFFELETHDEFLEAVTWFQEDLEFYYRQRKSYLRERTAKLRSDQNALSQYTTDDYVGVQWDRDDVLHIYGRPHPLNLHLEQGMEKVAKDLSCLAELASGVDQVFGQYREISAKAFAEIDAIFRKRFLFCLQHHQIQGVAFHAALECFIAGDLDAALNQIRFLIDLSEKNQFGDQLLAKLYFLKGQVQSDFYLYADAIVALTTSIQKDPSLKEAYFERAAVYFELGRFDKAVEDYLQSGFQNAPGKSLLQWKEMTQMSAGIGVGILGGASDSLVEFVPGLLGSLRGVSNGLWAFCTHPVGASQDFVNAAVQCVEYLKARSGYEIMLNLVPELKELIERYDQLESYEKGVLIGNVIGKYGIDILISNSATTAVKYFRELKTANRLMTLEALSSANAPAVIEAAAKKAALREQILRGGSLKIHADKQGKHIVGHKNYEPGKNRSIFEHREPDRLLKQSAGTGIKIGDPSVGSSGSQELVNFGEFIGYDVQWQTGIRTPTTWGKIHYAKDSVHIVPSLPPKG